MVNALKDYDVIVVGAGVSGLLSALALSKEGKNVLILEREKFVGGNLRTYSLDGYTVDTGLHAITHVNDGPLRKLMDEYFDIFPKFLPYGDYHIRMRNKLIIFPWTVQSWVNFEALPQKDRMTITSLLGSSVAFSIFGAVDKNQSVYDFLKKNEFSQKTWNFIDTMCYFMSGKSMMKTPVWRILRGARYMDEDKKDFIGDKVMGHIASFAKLVNYDGSYHQAYPRSGVGAITDCIIQSFPRGRVTIKCGQTVSSISGSSRATGVSTEGEEFTAPTVVYSGYMKDLPNLTEELPKQYVHDLETLEQTTSVTVWLGLDRKMKEFGYYGSEIWFEEGHFWGMPTSNYNDSFAPSGKQLVGFTSIVDGNPKGAEKKLMNSIVAAIPRIEDHIEFKHTQITIPEKAAITVGSKFPSTNSPLKGLYLVGTDTDIRSMGVTRASFSVLEMLSHMRKEGRLPEKTKTAYKKQHIKNLR
ncbi:MAG: NAD(P)/FAD-dependent oxidoreductase [Candidatus Altiarchaeota archaeon]